MSHRMSIRMNSRVHHPEKCLCCSYSNLCTEKETQLYRIMFSLYTVETVSHRKTEALFTHNHFYCEATCIPDHTHGHTHSRFTDLSSAGSVKTTILCDDHNRSEQGSNGVVNLLHSSDTKCPHCHTGTVHVLWCKSSSLCVHVCCFPQLDRVIFCVFLPKDKELYLKNLPLYFAAGELSLSYYIHTHTRRYIVTTPRLK